MGNTLQPLSVTVDLLLWSWSEDEDLVSEAVRRAKGKFLLQNISKGKWHYYFGLLSQEVELEIDAFVGYYSFVLTHNNQTFCKCHMQVKIKF